MKKILGNFLRQPNNDFPLDAETLDYLQNLTSISAIVGNIAGDKVILCGCESTENGNQRNPGWVFVKTDDFPDGEIIFWEGGSTTSGMYIKEDGVSVTANNVEYSEAYTERHLAPGYGKESFSWDDFTELRTISELIKENKTLQEKLDAVQTTPIGGIILWAGKEIPDGYLLCNGLNLEKEKYPELHDVIGDTYNKTIDSNGFYYSTPDGQFRIPDLQGRFVVGQKFTNNPGINDYGMRGSGGGADTVTLTIDQMPEHSHEVNDYYHAESKKTVQGTTNEEIDTNGKLGSHGSDNDNGFLVYYKHDTYSSGGGIAHENRPPYYVLAYIIRAK